MRESRGRAPSKILYNVSCMSLLFSTFEHATCGTCVPKQFPPQLCSPWCILLSSNVKSAFCRIPVRPEDWSLLILWQDQYFYESALPFRLYCTPVQLYGTLSHPPVNGLCASSSHSHACCITGNTSTNVTSSVHALDLC